MATSVSTAKYIPALRKAVDTLIKVDPRTVVLTPHEKVDKGGGAFDYEEGRPRAAQTFSITPEGTTDTPNTALGGAEAPRWTYTLVGRHDAVVELGDTWQDGDTLYRVVALAPKSDYQVSATVVAFGKDPNYGI